MQSDRAGRFVPFLSAIPGAFECLHAATAEKFFVALIQPLVALVRNNEINFIAHS
jgi:hypothetical protein